MGPGTFLAGVSVQLVTAAQRVRTKLGDPFRLLTRALRECAPENRENDDRLLVTRSTRVQPLWSDVQIAAENLDAPLGELIGLLEDVQGMLAVGEQGMLLDQDALAAEVADLVQIGGALQYGFGHALLEDCLLYTSPSPRD